MTIDKQILEDAISAGAHKVKRRDSVIVNDGSILFKNDEQLTTFAELTKARAIPDGYVLVPIEPTEGMLEAAELSIIHTSVLTNQPKFTTVKALYTAMIKAAQQERN